MSLFINIAALVIALVMIIPMHFYIPISIMFSFEYGFLNYILRFVALFAAMVVYMVVHELTHGIAMKCFGTKKIKYGFTGLYAFAGSDDYYDKKSYIIIALAPIVLWGVVLGVLNAGAVGDLYVTFKFGKMSKDILVQDSGVGMDVYSNGK